MTKKTTLFLLTALQATAAFACPVCERQQPRLLRGITHGAGPQNQLDYVIVAIVGIAVLATLVLSVKFLLQPRERSAGHIKHFILNID